MLPVFESFSDAISTIGVGLQEVASDLAAEFAPAVTEIATGIASWTSNSDNIKSFLIEVKASIDAIAASTKFAADQASNYMVVFKQLDLGAKGAKAIFTEAKANILDTPEARAENAAQWEKFHDAQD